MTGFPGTGTLFLENYRFSWAVADKSLSTVSEVAAAAVVFFFVKAAIFGFYECQLASQLSLSHLGCH
jgi:hypothetical protein